MHKACASHMGFLWAYLLTSVHITGDRHLHLLVEPFKNPFHFCHHFYLLYILHKMCMLIFILEKGLVLESLM